MALPPAVFPGNGLLRPPAPWRGGPSDTGSLIEIGGSNTMRNMAQTAMKDVMQEMEGFMDRNLALEVVRVTEAAALAAAGQVGLGDKVTADQVAVDAMRNALNSLHIKGRIVIGEGERDEAPMLYIGEEVGDG